MHRADDVADALRVWVRRGEQKLFESPGELTAGGVAEHAKGAGKFPGDGDGLVALLRAGCATGGEDGGEGIEKGEAVSDERQIVLPD